MSFPRYPKYKQIGFEGLEELPEHWEATPLKHLADVDSSGSYGVDPEGAERTIPVATTAQIDTDGFFDVDLMPIRGFTVADADRFGCRAGDMLIVKSSGSATNVISGKVGYVSESTPFFVFSNFLMRVRPRRSRVNPKFLFAVLRSSLTRQRVEQMCSTTTYPNLKVSQYVSAPLPTPPLPEQELIARFLDQETTKIDKLVSEQELLIDLLKEKRQAVISHVITKGRSPDAPMRPSGIEWIGDVPENWQVFPLKRDLEYVTSGARGWAENYADDGQLFLRIGNLTRDSVELDLSDVQRVVVPSGAEGLRTQTRPGDLLLSITAHLGSVAIIPDGLEPSYVSQHVALLRLRGRYLMPRWVAYCAASHIGRTWFDRQAYGGTKIQLSLDDVRDMVLTVPPVREQKEIVDFIERETSKAASLIAEAETATAVLEERRLAVVSAAVTGKIDVRGLADSEAA